MRILLLIWSRAVALFFDLLLGIGAALLTYGFWLAWKPSGYMLAGLVLIGLAFLYGGRLMPPRGELTR